jgi:hypothetical protein
VAFEAFVARYSGATVRDLHSLPYSPWTVVQGTCSWRSHKVTKTFKELVETMESKRETVNPFSSRWQHATPWQPQDMVSFF